MTTPLKRFIHQRSAYTKPQHVEITEIISCGQIISIFISYREGYCFLSFGIDRRPE